MPLLQAKLHPMPQLLLPPPPVGKRYNLPCPAWWTRVINQLLSSLIRILFFHYKVKMVWGVVLPGCTAVRAHSDFLFAACAPKASDNSCQESFHQVSVSPTRLPVSCVCKFLFLPYCFWIHNQKGTFLPSFD